MKVLFLNGIPNASNNLFSVKGDKMFIRYNGSSNVGNFIRTSHFEQLFAIVGYNEFQVLLEHRGDIQCIFNEISDADSHSNSLHQGLRILDSMPVPIINHPRNILQTSRDKIYQMLVGIDERLIVPQTIKVSSSDHNLSALMAETGLNFPVILRGCGSHGGIDTVLIQDSLELDEASDKLLQNKEYYLTQYYEYKDDSSLYTKCRLLVIDGEVYIRHWMHSKNWLVHARNRRREFDLLEKKKIKSFDASLKDKIQPLITKIFELVKLDYFGIDCHIDTKLNIILFELNATMNIFTTSAGSEHIAVSKLKDAVIKMIQRKVFSSVCGE